MCVTVRAIASDGVHVYSGHQAPIEPWDMGQQRFTVLNKQKAELFETDRETSI